jgi:hypothetical protein
MVGEYEQKENLGAVSAELRFDWAQLGNRVYWPLLDGRARRLEIISVSQDAKKRLPQPKLISRVLLARATSINPDPDRICKRLLAKRRSGAITSRVPAPQHKCVLGHMMK